MSMIIPLTKGYETIVDDEDYMYLMQWDWCIKMNTNQVTPSYYAYRRGKIGELNKDISMHNEIITKRMRLVIPRNKVVDHIDRDGLNNQQYNLRIVSRSMNRYNSKIQWNNSSGCTGVNQVVRSGKWVARISFEDQRIVLGTFDTYEEAVVARKKAEIKYYGENK